jgi:hypothetical protein
MRHGHIFLGSLWSGFDENKYFSVIPGKKVVDVPNLQRVFMLLISIVANDGSIVMAILNEWSYFKILLLLKYVCIELVLCSFH